MHRWLFVHAPPAKSTALKTDIVSALRTFKYAHSTFTMAAKPVSLNTVEASLH
jgi:hypothetical protein